MVVGFTTNYAVSITTKVVSLNPAHGKVYMIHLYMIKFGRVVIFSEDSVSFHQ